MQLDYKNTGSHYWITGFWCAFGAIILGTIAVISYWIRKCRPNNRKKGKCPNVVRRTSSANEFDAQALTAANRRQLFSRNRSASSEQENSDQSEHSEKSPLVTARPNLKYQYSALDSGSGVQERSPRERAARERALNACQEWLTKSNGRYDIIAHLDEIGSRHNKNWFLISDATVRTNRLMTLLPLPPDSVALDELPPSESPKAILIELLGSLHHPYIYPALDLGFLHTGNINYACLVTPFNSRGSLKDLIFKSVWNEPWNRKYTRKPQCLPVSQIQRLGRQILEALLFLKERGFPLHGHLHSGNVILQNGVARLSGLENSLLGISSRINAIMWSRSTSDMENIDIICFGHLLYEMCTGLEMTTPKPSIRVLEMDLERYPQVLEILTLIFDPPNGICPTVEELVLCDLFRGIDLRELRGASISALKPSLSRSTLNLLRAVKKRQTAALSSFSDTSSPYTPPSTPRDRRQGTIDSFEISSDSEDVLDEVVVTSSSYESSHQYDPLNSPIHFCDNSILSDDNSCANMVGLLNGSASGRNNGSSAEGNSSTSSSTTSCGPTTSRVGAGGLNDMDAASTPATSTLSSSSFNNQLTADMCNYKNSKSRRLEYSLKCLKYGRSNPSQDSAFGSLTDGDLSIGSSSFRLSSFQSITSPIDEGVEDIIIATTSAGHEVSIELATTTIDSALSTPCREGSPNFLICEDAHSKSQISLQLSPKIRCTSSSPSNLQFDPPKILVNDQNSIYTTSPSKRSGTIEVFSQKYRVSSFEDMSPNKRNTLKNVNRVSFRSLEEERRIDSAFMPMKDRTNSEHRVNTSSEKYKKLTHTSFRISNSSSVERSTSRDRHSQWKDSRFYRKTKIAKSNDSLLDSPLRHIDNHQENIKPSARRYYGSSKSEDIIDAEEDDFRIQTRKACSERHLFSMSKLKQTAIISDCLSEDKPLKENKKSSLSLSSCSINRNHCNKKVKTALSQSCSQVATSRLNMRSRPVVFKSLDIELNNFNKTSEDEEDDSSTEESPLHKDHQDMCRSLGGMSGPHSSSCSEEKTPLLLDSVEMSPISPTEPDLTM